jgi:ABC-2 type transport system permease protein
MSLDQVRFRPAELLLQAAQVGFADFRAQYTLRTWLFGWITRVVSQVIFFAMLGRLIGSDERTSFLLIGNAVAIASIEAFQVIDYTASERRAGTLPMMITAPASPLLGLVGRSSVLIAAAWVSSSLALVVAGWFFGIGLTPATVVMVVPAIGTVAFAAFGFGLFIAAVTVRLTRFSSFLSNLGYLSLLAFCGVQVPTDFWPAPIQHVTSVVPLTHGLRGVRELLADGPSIQAAAHLLLEVAVGVGWLAVGALLLRRHIEHGRRAGTLDSMA